MVSTKAQGLARQWCKDKDPGNGIQTWRDMLAKYDPTTGASLLDLQKRICSVKRGKTMNGVPDIIDRFEADYRVYRAKVGKEMDHLTRQKN